MHHDDPLIWLFLPVEFFDLYRLEEDLMTIAIFAPSALPPVFAEVPAAALLALAAPPPVLAKATAAALLAVTAPPPVLAEATAAALLAVIAPAPVLADAAATAVSLQMLRRRPCGQGMARRGNTHLNP